MVLIMLSCCVDGKGVGLASCCSAIADSEFREVAKRIGHDNQNVPLLVVYDICEACGYLLVFLQYVPMLFLPLVNLV